MDARQQTQIAIRSLRKDRELAGQTDLNGREIWPTLTDHGFDIDEREGGLVFDLLHRDEHVGTVRVEPTTPIKCVVTPADKSWWADCRNIADRLPYWWDVVIEEAT